MNPTELRALADALRPMAAAPCFDGIDIDRAADYLLACADEKPVAKITRAGSGSIAMFAPDGGPFDMSKYIGAALFTHPATAAPQAEPETFESELRSFAETPEQVAFVEKLIAAQAEPCIGNDPACPCQDGDACHYKDAGGTKAWPVPQAERPPTCRWSRADDDTDMWETTCGKAFTIIDGSPADNQMAFCCYCGRELESETGDSDAD